MMNFNQIYSENYKKVLYHILGRVHSQVIAEELTQDVFVKVYDNIENYDENLSSETTWVYTIANRIIIDHWRKVNKDRQLETTSINAVIDEEGREYFEASIGDTPLSELMNTEYKDALKECVLALPNTYRRMANLRYNNGMSYEEIAERMHLSLGTVKGKLSRAKQIIKENIIEGKVVQI